VDEIVQEYNLCPIDMMILDSILMKEPTDSGRIKQYEDVIRFATERIEDLKPLIEEEKRQAKGKKVPDKRDIILENAAKTINDCLKKISAEQSTYKHISKSMESLLNEIASKDQLDLFNH
jgi:TRAP-type mannitol/chloroaromatic compound transport system substrate-binding protein